MFDRALNWAVTLGAGAAAVVLSLVGVLILMRCIARRGAWVGVLAACLVSILCGSVSVKVSTPSAIEKALKQIEVRALVVSASSAEIERVLDEWNHGGEPVLAHEGVQASVKQIVDVLSVLPPQGVTVDSLTSAALQRMDRLDSEETAVLALRMQLWSNGLPRWDGLPLALEAIAKYPRSVTIINHAVSQASYALLDVSPAQRARSGVSTRPPGWGARAMALHLVEQLNVYANEVGNDPERVQAAIHALRTAWHIAPTEVPRPPEPEFPR